MIEDQRSKPLLISILINSGKYIIDECYVAGKEEAYTKLEVYLPRRIITQKQREEWYQLLSHAHIQYGTGKSELIARVWCKLKDWRQIIESFRLVSNIHVFDRSLVRHAFSLVWRDSVLRHIPWILGLRKQVDFGRVFLKIRLNAFHR